MTKAAFGCFFVFFGLAFTSCCEENRSANGDIPSELAKPANRHQQGWHTLAPGDKAAVHGTIWLENLASDEAVEFIVFHGESRLNGFRCLEFAIRSGKPQKIKLKVSYQVKEFQLWIKSANLVCQAGDLTGERAELMISALTGCQPPPKIAFELIRHN